MNIDARVATAAAKFHRASERPSSVKPERSFNIGRSSAGKTAVASSPQAKPRALQSGATLTSGLRETAAALVAAQRLCARTRRERRHGR